MHAEDLEKSTRLLSEPGFKREDRFSDRSSAVVVIDESASKRRLQRISSGASRISI
ncbi:hypothetical protein T472_0218365 [Youngiibacter fragilis 232.1]|uniref:Uncharacterized protein n=2 Tax=Youngiibacter TaxID=1408818 RepID=V7I1X0_9CLOT|nr:hypothetical protein T472_0218365 [Youngiibacter fragilis 232.1]